MLEYNNARSPYICCNKFSNFNYIYSGKLWNFFQLKTVKRKGKKSYFNPEINNMNNPKQATQVFRINYGLQLL